MKSSTEDTVIKKDSNRSKIVMNLGNVNVSLIMLDKFLKENIRNNEVLGGEGLYLNTVDERFETFASLRDERSQASLLSGLRMNAGSLEEAGDVLDIPKKLQHRWTMCSARRDSSIDIVQSR